MLRKKLETWDSEIEENENLLRCREKCSAKSWWQHILYWVCVGSVHREQWRQKVLLSLLVMLDDSLESRRMVLRQQIPAS